MNTSYPSLYDPTATLTNLYLSAYLPDGTEILNRSQVGISVFAPISGTYWLPGGVSYSTTGIWTVWDNAGIAYPPELLIDSTPVDIGTYTPIVLLGPEGSPNGTLAAAPQTVVVTPGGQVFVKSLGNGDEGWIQTQ